VPDGLRDRYSLRLYILWPLPLNILKPPILSRLSGEGIQGFAFGMTQGQLDGIDLPAWENKSVASVSDSEVSESL